MNHVGHPMYSIWLNMRQRCENPRATKYENYGGKGVTVCPEWRESFEAFVRDMGERPSPKHTIDRIDSSKGYEPSNCRWLLWAENSARRTYPRPDVPEPHPLTLFRERRGMMAKELASAAGVSACALSKVENGHRDRLGADACMALAEAFPGELDLEELLAWSWSKAKRRRAS